MSVPGWRRTLALALIGGGFAIATSSSVVALGLRSSKVTSYATASPGFAVLASLTGAVLLTAASLLARDTARTLTALATFALGAAWSADVWAGWPPAPAVLRGAAMLFGPMLAPLALLAVASVLGSRAVPAAVLVAGAGLTSAIALWLVRDPFLDRYCWRDCLAHSFAPFSGTEAARTATNVALVVAGFCGTIAAVLCAAAFSRRPLAFPLVAGLASGCTLAASDFVLRFEPAEDPTRPLYAFLYVARAVSLLGLGAALGYVAVRPVLVRRAISRLAADPSRSEGGLEAALADAIGDRGLRLAYPLPAGPVVDADGRPVELEPSAVQIVRGKELVALVDSPAGAPTASAIDRALGPPARLALANERLRAEQLFRLHELMELRRRIVATGDAARRRLERDLHDGAQQRLLALAIDLRVALKQAAAAGKDDLGAILRRAVSQVDGATCELRSIAHGIFPSVLASAGLAAALDSLADERPLLLAIELELERRFPTEIEAAAYALVAEETAGASAPVRVRVETRESALVVALDDALNSGASLAEERIGAAGGTLTRAGRRLEAVLPIPPHAP
jgi:signal transduction histidine kinase